MTKPGQSSPQSVRPRIEAEVGERDAEINSGDDADLDDDIWIAFEGEEALLF